MYFASVKKGSFMFHPCFTARMIDVANSGHTQAQLPVRRALTLARTSGRT